MSSTSNLQDFLQAPSDYTGLDLSKKNKINPPGIEVIKEYKSNYDPISPFENSNPAQPVEEHRLKILSTLIRHGNNRIQDQEKHAILLLGATGSGKSTLTHSLIRKPLYAYKDKGDMLLKAVEPLEDIIIGEGMGSETTIPNKCKVGETAIWDCPGFNDTDDIQDIANRFYIKKLFENSKNLKFVLVVSESELKANKGSNFIEVVKHLIGSFTNINAIKPSMSLVVTQVGSDVEMVDIEQKINSILSQNKKATDDVKTLIKYLIQQSLHKFSKPDKEGEFESPDILSDIQSKTKFIETKSDLANINISEGAKLISNNLLSEAKYNLNQVIDVVARGVINASESITETDDNIFIKEYGIIKEHIPGLIVYPNLRKLDKHYFSEILLLFNLREAFNKRVSSINNGIDILLKALDILGQFSLIDNDNISENALYENIFQCSYVVKQQFDYIMFFSDVTKQKIPDFVNLEKIINLCKNQVTEKLEYSIKKLKIESDQPTGYYEEAIQYLDLYKDSPLCKELKAQCHINLGSLAEKNNDTTTALKEYIKAMSDNKFLPDIYQKLGQLFFEKKQYEKAIKCYKIVNNSYKIEQCFKQWMEDDKDNSSIMMMRADYLLSIGEFAHAIKYYNYVIGLSQEFSQKDNALFKIAHILDNTIKISGQFKGMAQAHDYYNYEQVSAEFVTELVGENSV